MKIDGKKIWSLYNRTKGAQYDGLTFKEAKAIIMILAPEERLDWFGFRAGWPDWKPLKECLELITFSAMSRSGIVYEPPPSPPVGANKLSQNVLDPPQDGDEVDEKKERHTTVTEFMTKSRSIGDTTSNPKIVAPEGLHNSAKSSSEKREPLKNLPQFSMDDISLSGKNVSATGSILVEPTNSEVDNKDWLIPEGTRLQAPPLSDEEPSNVEMTKSKIEAEEAQHELTKSEYTASEIDTQKKKGIEDAETAVTQTRSYAQTVRQIPKKSELEPDFQDDVKQLSKRAKFDLSEINARSKEEALEHMRRFKRYDLRLHVEIIANLKRFTSFTKDISLGGIALEDSIPDWVAGYCTLVLSTPDLKHRLEFMCSIVENQEGNRTRLEIYPSSDSSVLREWLEEGVPGQSEAS